MRNCVYIVLSTIRKDTSCVLPCNYIFCLINAESSSYRNMNVSVLQIFVWLCSIIQGMTTTTAKPCQRKYFERDPNRMVCQCTKAYCDQIVFSSESLTPRTADVYSSDQSFDRLELIQINSTSHKDIINTDQRILLVDTSVKMQSIFGFGGAFTDAAVINIASLSSSVQKALLTSYFGQNGIGYTVGRIPMASCDFSTREYSYDDVAGDFNLTHFNLAKEDDKYKIPYLLAAQSLSDNQMRYFGSPWSAPAWMKTSGTMNNNGTLKGKAGDQYHKTWANYFLKFLQAYADENVKLWGLTVQNEPLMGFVPGYSFQTMGYTGAMERDFVKLDLGPALRNSGFANVKLMIFDDSRGALDNFTEQILEDADAAHYVDGIAVHWYRDDSVNPEALDDVHDKYPDKFLLMTEACAGWNGPDQGVSLGNWSRAELYAHDIMQNLNHWATGWVDWNIALNLEGGPNWVRNFVDSPIIVDASEDSFYKQPTFFAMAHFSKFLIPGSQRVPSSWRPNQEFSDNYLEVTTFLRPDDIRVMIILNRSDNKESFTIKERDSSIAYEIVMPGHAIKTVLWKPE